MSRSPEHTPDPANSLGFEPFGIACDVLHYSPALGRVLKQVPKTIRTSNRSQPSYDPDDTLRVFVMESRLLRKAAPTLRTLGGGALANSYFEEALMDGLPDDEFETSIGLRPSISLDLRHKRKLIKVGVRLDCTKILKYRAEAYARINFMADGDFPSSEKVLIALGTMSVVLPGQKAALTNRLDQQFANLSESDRRVTLGPPQPVYES